MSDPHFETALSRHKSADAGDLCIGISEISDRGMIDLRGLQDDAKFMAAAKKALGIDLPGSPRTSAAKGELSILWLSIDQWLVCCPRDDTAKLLAKLNRALAGCHSLAVDLSDARSIIRLNGDGVREVLMKGAPVDLLEMEQGTVRRLRFGEIAAMVHLVETGPDVIDLYVFRSYSDFAWDWLMETARKTAGIHLFGIQETPPT